MSLRIGAAIPIARDFPDNQIFWTALKPRVQCLTINTFATSRASNKSGKVSADLLSTRVPAAVIECCINDTCSVHDCSPCFTFGSESDSSSWGNMFRVRGMNWTPTSGDGFPFACNVRFRWNVPQVFAQKRRTKPSGLIFSVVLEWVSAYVCACPLQDNAASRRVYEKEHVRMMC